MPPPYLVVIHDVAMANLIDDKIELLVLLEERSGWYVRLSDCHSTSLHRYLFRRCEKCVDEMMSRSKTISRYDPLNFKFMKYNEPSE